MDSSPLIPEHLSGTKGLGMKTSGFWEEEEEQQGNKSSGQGKMENWMSRQEKTEELDLMGPSIEDGEIFVQIWIK